MKKRLKKLLDQVRDVIRLKHYSIRTEKSYVNWIRRYILCHNKRHPKEMGKCEISSFWRDFIYLLTNPFGRDNYLNENVHF